MVSRLVEWGHQRIVLITRADRSKPHPGGFMESLARHGIATSDYHFPEWGGSPDDMTRLLESLFRYTPPTALILSEATFFRGHAVVEPDWNVGAGACVTRLHGPESSV